MNRESLFARLTPSRNKVSNLPASGRETRLVGLEPLEDRKMLVASVYMNDNWVNVTDPGNPVEIGDLVSNSADVNSPGSVTREYGFDAFGIVGGTSVAGVATIHDAMVNVSTNGTLNILGGTYKESDIVVTTPMRISGATGVQKTLIVPEVVSNHADANFGTGSHSGFIIYSPNVTIENLQLDGNGNGSLAGTMNYHQGITTLYDTQNGGNYATVRNGNLAPSNLVAANQDTNLRLTNVTVSNTWWHGITLSGISGTNISNNTINGAVVNNVGQAGSRGLDRVGILIMNHDGGQILNSTVSNAGVGIASMIFGEASFGSNDHGRNKTGMRLNTVTDAEQRAYSISMADGLIDLNFLLTADTLFNGFDANKANFTSTANNAIGLYINHSEPVVLGYESTNAKIGVKIEDTTTVDLLLPIFTGATINGPGTGVAGSVGILADNVNDPTHPISFGIASTVKISGFETGIRVNQAAPVLAEKNTALIDRPTLTGNGTAIFLGNNSLLQGNANTTNSVVTSGNGTIQPGFPDSFLIADGPDSFAGPFGDTFKFGNTTFNSSSTFDARLTGQTGSTTVFDFTKEVGAFPFGLIPPVPVDGGTTAPYGSSIFPGQVVQTGGELRFQNGALNALTIAFSTLNHPDPNVAGRYILDPVDISKYSTLNVVAKLGSANQSKAFIIGLADTDGDLALFTVSTEGLNSTSFSTITINLAAPGIPVSLGPDGNFELSKVMGFAVLGDEGLLNGATNVPFEISFSEVNAGSILNSTLDVTGAVNLNGANLNVSLNDTFAPTLNQQFTIINNDGVDAISGTFAGVANGATVAISGHKYQVNYNGGTGNDVVLTFKGDVPVGGTTTVVDRHIFYNQSAWDGNTAAIDPVNDNLAIAPDKDPYLPGAGVASYNNITSYTRGINGIMIDISSTGGNHAAISASDFVFKVGNNNSPNSWATAPAPTAISVVPGGGVGGADRVIITWTAAAITNKWLEVQMAANATTGLAATEVHFWGNKIGDSGTSPAPGVNTFDTSTADASQVFASLGLSKPITDLRDYDRSKSVATADASAVFANLGSINRINIPLGGPFAPEADPAVVDDGSNSAIASALASKAGLASLPKLPGWISSRLSNVDLNSGPIAKLFTQLAESNTPRANAVLAKVNEVTDALDLDDSLLESLIAGRG